MPYKDKEKKRKYLEQRKISGYWRYWYLKNREKILQQQKEYRQKPESKKKKREYYLKNKKKFVEHARVYVHEKRKIDKILRDKDIIKRATNSKFGSAKKYWCVFCFPKKSAIEWHHYNRPYKFDKAIPLCKFHHKKFHTR